MQQRLPRFLPGTLAVQQACPADYRDLARFHYRAGPPATWAGMLRIDHSHGQTRRIIAIGVLSWPTAVSRGRRERFGLQALDFGGQIRFANRRIRTISRVIVHPQFRGLGLASLLVRGLLELCPTRYVEATAAMGSIHPLFEQAGMARLDPAGGGAPYFWFDRWRKSAWN